MRENNSHSLKRFDLMLTRFFTLREFMLVGGHFLLLFNFRLNICDKSNEQGNSGAFARLRTKA